MKVITSIKLLYNQVDTLKKSGKKTGFVATMGALHAGHTSLITRSVEENDFTLASIFVNPSQFNDKKDLENYPRMPEQDHNLLKINGCDLIFEPAVNEMYPDKIENIDIDLGTLATVMEGKFRPGHFLGMATIVYKLLSLANPTNAYFGEKDFQQLAIIRFMVKKLNMGVHVIGCPTIREPDGLAMSSRNIHLSAEERLQASLIYKSMLENTGESSGYTVKESVEKVIEKIEKNGLFNVEYFEIVNSETLQSVTDWNADKKIRACIAVKTSKTRLIDNIAVL